MECRLALHWPKSYICTPSPGPYKSSEQPIVASSNSGDKGEVYERETVTIGREESLPKDSETGLEKNQRCMGRSMEQDKTDF